MLRFVFCGIILVTIFSTYRTSLEVSKERINGVALSNLAPSQILVSATSIQPNPSNTGDDSLTESGLTRTEVAMPIQESSGSLDKSKDSGDDNNNNNNNNDSKDDNEAIDECRPVFPGDNDTPSTNDSDTGDTTVDSDGYTVIDNVQAVHETNWRERVQAVLKQKQAIGHLRNDWSVPHTDLSHWAEKIANHQQQCHLPVASFHMDNSFGFGSHVALWSQGVCNAMEAGHRMRTDNPDWLWLDQTLCPKCLATKSPWLCYFPDAEYKCGYDEAPSKEFNVTDPRDKKKTQCKLLKASSKQVLHDFRAASTEYLFRSVSPVVVREAKRQTGLLFPNGTAPEDLVAVHIRWGDKFWEMDLVNLTDYLDAVRTVLTDAGRPTDRANIFVATEDPKVVAELKNATPPGWNIYYDPTVEELQTFRPPKGNRASHMARNTKGRAGLMGLGSLLVALEAKLFVLTTGSNWSRMIDHLRTNIIDKRCGNCTKMIDLRPGVW